MNHCQETQETFSLLLLVTKVLLATTKATFSSTYQLKDCTGNPSLALARLARLARRRGSKHSALARRGSKHSALARRGGKRSALASWLHASAMVA